MAQIDRTPDQLDGILVTHEHRDHIHGVGVLARKYHLDVFANQQTWEAMEPLIEMYQWNKNIYLRWGKSEHSAISILRVSASPMTQRLRNFIVSIKKIGHSSC